MARSGSGSSRRKIAGVGDAAVREATGIGWTDWLARLDAAGAAGWAHREIARWLGAEHPEIGGWWVQMITVGFEQERGLRQKHQQEGGYSANASRTIGAAPEAAFQAWKDGRRRRSWLPEAALELRTATAPKSLRYTWSADGSVVAVWIEARGAGRCRVAVQQSQLARQALVGPAKERWGAALDRLKERLEAAD